MAPRILLPTDLSECSWQALPHAVELAKRLGGHLTLLGIVQPYTPVHLGIDAGFGTAQETLESLEQDDCTHVREELVRRAATLPEALATTVVVRVAAHPANEIIEQARELRANYVVMATHGRTGIGHALLGSVTERVLRSCDVPVLTVRAHTEA
ncbi:MAG: universal stress protein [Planctomycetes bacterium]|nr:universal stress protein [Planctomycetota bacterium]MCB9891816.1 universal stress protein [Planctomycetota bacterium]